MFIVDGSLPSIQILVRSDGKVSNDEELECQNNEKYIARWPPSLHFATSKFNEQTFSMAWQFIFRILLSIDQSKSDKFNQSSRASSLGRRGRGAIRPSPTSWYNQYWSSFKSLDYEFLLPLDEEKNIGKKKLLLCPKIFIASTTKKSALNISSSTHMHLYGMKKKVQMNTFKVKQTFIFSIHHIIFILHKVKNILHAVVAYSIIMLRLNCRTYLKTIITSLDSGSAMLENANSIGSISVWEENYDSKSMHESLLNVWFSLQESRLP